MKTNTHPAWHDDCLVSCSCGNTFLTGSVLPEIKTDMCSACHPFFTGEMKFVDVQGRVEKFQAKMQQAITYKATVKAKKAKSSKAKEVKSLKEMMSELKKSQ